MNWLFLAINLLSLLVGIAAAITFVRSSRAFTPGLLRHMVWTGGLMAGLLAVGEFIDHTSDLFDQPMYTLGASGDALVIVATILFVAVMYAAARFGRLFGFRHSPYFKSPSSEQGSAPPFAPPAARP